MSLVIDTGPDFRNQALRHRLTRLDAVLFSHEHFDHVAGIDDLRPFLFNNPKAIPCYAHPKTAAVLRDMFRYIFDDRSYPGVANLTLHSVEGAFDIHDRYDSAGSIRIIPVEAFHGDRPIYGYRIGRFGYLTDTSRIPESSYPLLQDIDVLVLDALRHEPHPTHFSIEEAVEEARRIGARQTYFIHMTHTMLHAEEDAQLPEGISLGYDGLQVEVKD